MQYFTKAMYRLSQKGLKGRRLSKRLSTDRYSSYFRKAAVAFDQEILDQINFHDCIITRVEWKDKDLILYFDVSGGFTLKDSIVFNNCEILRQEENLEDLRWIYDEVYKIGDLYKVEVMLGGKELVYFDILFSDIDNILEKRNLKMQKIYRTVSFELSPVLNDGIELSSRLLYSAKNILMKRFQTLEFTNWTIDIDETNSLIVSYSDYIQSNTFPELEIQAFIRKGDIKIIEVEDTNDVRKEKILLTKNEISKYSSREYKKDKMIIYNSYSYNVEIRGKRVNGVAINFNQAGIDIILRLQKTKNTKKWLELELDGKQVSTISVSAIKCTNQIKFEAPFSVDYTPELISTIIEFGALPCEFRISNIIVKE